jgi:hypothetical protein
MMGGMSFAVDASCFILYLSGYALVSEEGPISVAALNGRIYKRLLTGFVDAHPISGVDSGSGDG